MSVFMYTQVNSCTRKIHSVLINFPVLAKKVSSFLFYFLTSSQPCVSYPGDFSGEKETQNAQKTERRF